MPPLRAARALPPQNSISHARVSRREAELVEGAMKRIIRANIDRFKQMLDAETDPAKRALLCRLLAEQEAELKEADEISIKKAY